MTDTSADIALVPPELLDVPYRAWRQGKLRTVQISPMKWAYEWVNLHTDKSGAGYVRGKHGFQVFSACHENLDPERIKANAEELQS